MLSTRRARAPSAFATTVAVRSPASGRTSLALRRPRAQAAVDSHPGTLPHLVNGATRGEQQG